MALLLVSWLASDALGAPPGQRARRPAVHRAGASIDNSGRMDANLLDMFVTNHGSFGWDLSTSGPGLIFPKGTTKTALFAAGLWMGALVNDSIRTCVAEYSEEFVPGPMVNHTFQVDNQAYRNYTLETGITTSDDYLSWPSGEPEAGNPSKQGAPLDTLGHPALSGDKTIWSVYNDADPAAHTNTSAGRTKPLGVEIQQTTFAYGRSGALGNIIFLRFRIANKGVDTLKSAYISIWADPDLGDASDDLIGCDTTLSLGYCYNETNNDAVYGSAPPAIGFDFFRGPIIPTSTPGVYDTLGMTSFNKYTNGTDPTSPFQAYNLMKGLNKDGTPLHVNNDPLQPVTTFQVSGDPVTSTGWLDGTGSDRRMQLSTGPFTMSPGDTQVVVCALIVGQGTDRLSSITTLRQYDDEAQTVFDLNFDIPSPPPNPTVWVHALDRGIRLIWGREPVGTNSANAKLKQDFHFEGFRVWQLASGNAQASPRVIATIDEDDSVAAIYSDLFNKEKGAVERTLVMNGTNSGLRFALDISNDALRGGRLINDKEYYFAVTAYSFDVLNTGTFFLGVNPIGTITATLESGIKVITATPRGSNAVLTVEGTQTAGDHVGHRLAVEQLVPNLLADSLYRVTFAPDESWTLVNLATGDTLLADQANQSGDFDYPIVNGFMPRVISATKPALIYQHLASGDSINLAAGNPDSSGIYHLDNYVDINDFSWYNFADGTNHDYRIEVLPDTTEPCWEYNFGDPSPQAGFKCPFKIFDLGACSYQDPSDDQQVTAMIRDDDGSGSWTWGDRLYIRDIPYASVPWGTSGLLSTDVNAANDDQTLGRIALVAEDDPPPQDLPPPGEIKIRGGRLCTQDVFEFRVKPVGSAPGTIVGNDIKKILAVPNPYYAHSIYELTQFDRVMKFTNIPASRKVTIRIFNLAGDLVRTITRIPSTADEMARAEIRWDLNTDRNLPVGSGVYIYRVEVAGVGSKTDRLAVFVERERLDNY